MEPSEKQAWVAYATYGAWGFQLVALVSLGAYGGYKLDQKWASDPWMMIVGLFLGATIGFYTLFRQITKFNERS